MEEKFITINSNRRKIVLNISTILYVLMRGKRVEIHVSGGRIYDTRMTLSEIEKKLGEGFIKVHRGCVVSAMAIHDITNTINLNNGESACKVAYDFVFSSEFANLPISNEERVRRMYLTFLNREADPAGLADWTAVLDNGCSIGHIFYGFTQSNEYCIDLRNTLCI